VIIMSDSESSTTKSTKSKKGKAEDPQKAYQDALGEGFLGRTHDELDNDAYTVGGQGEDTARAERDARERIRAEQLKASRDPDY
jgi:hypothetical protein